MSNSGTVGQIPTFDFLGFQIQGVGGVQPQAPLGSSAGVPPPQGAVGMVASGTGSDVAGIIGQGQYSASLNPLHQPVFWSFALMAIGVIMLAHVAHVSTRR